MTKMVKTVTNILKLSLTHFVSNIDVAVSDNFEMLVTVSAVFVGHQHQKDVSYIFTGNIVTNIYVACLNCASIGFLRVQYI